VAARPEAAAHDLTWKHGRFASWLTTTDHKRIGILYIGTSLLFFVVAGLLALLIRIQLAAPEQDFITQDKYNELFTIHGTAMVFLVVVPILAGFGNFMVPLMIGARDMAFPRLNAMSYWFFVLGGVVLYGSFLANGGASSAGWTGYPPLSETAYSPGNGVDLWILSLHLLTLSSLAGAINFTVTILNMRTAGMTFMRMPLFVWAIFTYAVLLILILPALSGGLTLLLLDRQADTHFFNVAEGGNALLWQNVFWFFGHPEVYVMILPAFGIVSEVVPVFSRKPIFGYAAIAFSTLGIAFIGMIVWAHHLFTVGYSSGLNSYFMIASFLVAIPTGIKILNWLATMWRGNISFDTPMLFALGLISLFVIGGLTGIFLAAFPVDWQLHDTYYVVGHFHYTLFGGAIFGIFAGLYYWWPKMFGRRLDERLGKWHFWLQFAGFNLTFMPQHLLGLVGMPRRIYTYPADRPESWEIYNKLSTIGAFIMAVGLLVFFVNVLRSRSYPRVGNDPWLGDTLEWFAASPPPPWNWDAPLPYVTSPRPLRDLRLALQEKRGAF
jgi:cytochrome c oxidase subunit 1